MDLNCFFVLVALLAISSIEAVSDEPEIENWEQFKSVYGKKYASFDEEFARRENFLKTLEWIRENRGKHGVDLAINEWSDLTIEQLVGKATELVPKKTQKQIKAPTDVHADKLPENFDWRNHITLNPIESQAGCGACWAFTSSFLVETQYAIKENKSIHLSKQELIDCTSIKANSKYDNNGCDGGNVGVALTYVVENGLAEEVNYPYERRTNFRCSRPEGKKYTIKNWGQPDYAPADEEIMNAIKLNGPVAVSIHANDVIKNYKGNRILRDIEPGSLIGNHAVSIIGWGKSGEGIEYWILRNSWGLTFGDKGYFYVERNNNNLGINYHVTLAEL